MVNDIIKHIVGNKVVAVTETNTIKDKLGKNLASVSKNIGKIFGFDTDMFSNIDTSSTGSSSGSYDIDKLYSDDMYAEWGGKENFKKAQDEALKKAQSGEGWGWQKKK